MRWLMMSLVLGCAVGCATWPSEVWRPIMLPEARTIDYRDPESYPSAKIPVNKAPHTVASLPPMSSHWKLSLDDAIRVALENARVIRVLAGQTAVASGKTIYDAAITQTGIDQAQARFDPALTYKQDWTRPNAPFAVTDITDFRRSVIVSNPSDVVLSNFGLNKINRIGGTAGLTWVENYLRYPGGGPSVNPLFQAFGAAFNPQTSDSLALSYSQPLLQGAGFRVNNAPIVIARLNTEASFFQYKDSVQEMVRGVIEAYWSLVQARTDLWAREKQVELSEFTYQRELARLDAGLADRKDVAQAEVTYTQFKANLVVAEAAMLAREAALRNILGLPPSDDRFIVPVSAPTENRLAVEWDKLVKLAEARRPDLVELKIVLEADQQRLMRAENQVLPQLNAFAQYRWNGLTGTMPNGQGLASPAGKFTDWTVGVNFSVPLGFRQGRAVVRQEKLLIERDRANLDQAVHAAIHELGATIRDLDSAFKQYEAYKRTRKAAETNVMIQDQQFEVGRAIYLNVLQALTDWGNAVSAEAAALLNYNVALASLERRTGTILETHGLVFHEERFRAAGPLLHRSHDRDYPSAIVPTGSPQSYPASTDPAENWFKLRSPVPPLQRSDVRFLPPIAVDRGR